ncbi:hypothetical protein PGT21_023972 [Puccinia graminis f. sp. tritici]|uniref:Uncharacterized protein n=1 Tax=Puccinia graminis f. sp. tritici TaxID=56615 RepID=A0A5B0M471_PUCGR|nr:hypothetical protein PGT21_023972 [Puccinia graminis f. sp. tritici]
MRTTRATPRFTPHHCDLLLSSALRSPHSYRALFPRPFFYLFLSFSFSDILNSSNHHSTTSTPLHLCITPHVVSFSSPQQPRLEPSINEYKSSTALSHSMILSSAAPTPTNLSSNNNRPSLLSTQSSTTRTLLPRFFHFLSHFDNHHNSLPLRHPTPFLLFSLSLSLIHHLSHHSLTLTPTTNPLILNSTLNGSSRADSLYRSAHLASANLCLLFLPV